MKRVVGNALLVLVSVAIAFGIVEGIARILEHRSASATRDPVPAPVEYVQRPGYWIYPPGSRTSFVNEIGQPVTIDVDENGLRNAPHALDSAQVVLLGDSYAFGANTTTESTLAGLLRAGGVRLYDAGMDGYSTFNEVRLLGDLLKRAHPKTVVVLAFLGNDFRDNYAEAIGGPAAVTTAQASRYAGLRRLAAHSAVVRRLRTAIRGNTGAVSDPMLSYSLGEMAMLRDSLSHAAKVAVENTDSALVRLARMSEASKFDVLLVGLPSKAQVERSFHEISGFETDPRSKTAAMETIRGGYSFDRPDSIFAALAAKNNLKYVSLMAPFRAAASDSLYYKIDVHWSPRGERLAADFLLPLIRGAR